MPTFNAESPNLLGDGPLIEVTFGLVPAAIKVLQDAGEPIPSPVKATAMIDTGASGTAVKAGLLAPLGLHPVGVVPVNTPTGSGVPCATYAVQLVLPNGFVDVTVIEAGPLGGQNIQALIGRDVLQHGIFIYQGPSQQFTLSF